MSAGGTVIPPVEEENPPENFNNTNTNIRNPRAIREDEIILIDGILNRYEEEIPYENLKDIKYRVTTDTAQATILFRLNEELLGKPAAGGAERVVKYMILIDGDIHHTFFPTRVPNLESIFFRFEDSWFNSTPLGTITITHSNVVQEGGKRKGKGKGKTRQHHKSKKIRRTRKRIARK